VVVVSTGTEVVVVEVVEVDDVVVAAPTVVPVVESVSDGRATSFGVAQPATTSTNAAMVTIRIREAYGGSG
jgi:hypothetical protein